MNTPPLTTTFFAPLNISVLVPLSKFEFEQTGRINKERDTAEQSTIRWNIWANESIKTRRQVIRCQSFLVPDHC